MIFTRRHERQLAEIKALHAELGENATAALEQIRGIQKLHGIKPKRPAPSAPEPRSQAPARAEPLLAFVHIPKTAGATTISLLTAAYIKADDKGGAGHQHGQHEAATPAAVDSESADLAFVEGLQSTETVKAANALVRPVGNYFRYPTETVEKVSRAGRRSGGERWRAMVGHVPYGLFRQYLPADTRYMTFLRDPVDRVISHYYRHVQIARGPGGRRGRTKRSPDQETKRRRVKAESLEEALVELRLPDLSNLATRLLCGDPAPGGDLSARALDDAKANLRDFAFVGIQERFEESVVLLHRLLGLELAAASDRHVNPERPAVEDISDVERRLIVDHNALDIELYDFGLELFEKAVAGADEGLGAEARSLRGRSAAANEEYRTALEDAWAWLDRELPAGAAVPEASLRAAAGEAGIPDLLLKRASRQMGLSKEPRAEGWFLRRPP